MSRNSQKPTVTVNSFPGLRTVDDAVEVGHTGLTKALNVDITRKNKVKRRKGVTQVSTLGGASVTAAWATDGTVLFTDGTNLTAVDLNYALTVLRSDLTATSTLSAIVDGNRIIYSNGLETGIVEGNTNKQLGVVAPPRVIASAASYGDMRKGLYQVVTTYVRADGFESGAGIATPVTLSEDNTGLSVFHEASSNADVVGINLYVSRADGTELYFAMQVDNTTDSVIYNAHANFLGRQLRTQFRVPPPAFDVVAMGRNNRMMYAKGDTIYISDPYSPEHIMEGEAYIKLPARITMIGTIEGGTFIATDENTYFVKGNTMDTAQLEIVAPYGAVLGSSTHIDGALLGDGEVSDILPVWMSHRGLCAGMPGGVINNLTQTLVDIPKGLKGTTMFRQEDGQNHIISVIQK